MRSASPHPQRRRSRSAAAVVERRATNGGACRHTRRGGTRSDLPQARRCCSHSCARAARPPHEMRPRSQVDGPPGSPTLPRCCVSRMRRASRGRRAIRRLPPAARGEACRLRAGQGGAPSWRRICGKASGNTRQAGAPKHRQRFLSVRPGGWSETPVNSSGTRLTLALGGGLEGPLRPAMAPYPFPSASSVGVGRRRGSAWVRQFSPP